MINPLHKDLDKILARVADTGQGLDGEFLFSPESREHTPRLIALGAWNGFLPMGAGRGERVVLLKLHRKRCALEPLCVHVGRHSRKLSSRFRLSVDEAFDEVVRATQQNTFTENPGDNWLTDDLAAHYASVAKLPAAISKGVKMHSVELWHLESGVLAAGEIGYAVGGIYSSCTGFALKQQFPGAGTLQLAALGRWLHHCGFAIWDLGMALDYKLVLGGRLHPRKTWVAMVRQHRSAPTLLISPPRQWSAREILMLVAGQPMASAEPRLKAPRTEAASSKTGFGRRARRRAEVLVEVRPTESSELCDEMLRAIEDGKDDDADSGSRSAALEAILGLSPICGELLRCSYFGGAVSSTATASQAPSAAANLRRASRDSGPSTRGARAAGPELLERVAASLEKHPSRNQETFELQLLGALRAALLAATSAEVRAATSVANLVARALFRQCGALDRVLTVLSSAGETSLRLAEDVILETIPPSAWKAATAAIAQDHVLWSLRATALAPGVGPCTLPPDLVLTRLALVAASALLEPAAAERVLQAHIYENLEAYLDWELAAEQHLAPGPRPSANNAVEVTATASRVLRRVLAAVLPSGRVSAEAAAIAAADVAASNTSDLCGAQLAAAVQAAIDSLLRAQSNELELVWLQWQQEDLRAGADRAEIAAAKRQKSGVT